jgi:hypothetical protein
MSSHRRLLALAVAIGLSCPVLLGAARLITQAPGSAPAPATLHPRPDGPSGARARMTREVESGLRLARRRWWRNGWFVDPSRSNAPATIWTTVHLLEAADGLASARPDRADRALATSYGIAFEGFWDPDLAGGVGGYAAYYRSHGEVDPNWFDDNGWLGLAFLDSFRVTGRKRFLRDAERAFRYVFQVGWDDEDGGIWWTSRRDFKAGESIVTAALLSASLYQVSSRPAYLTAARAIVDWANAHILDPSLGLYTRLPVPAAPISYLQSPMLDAMARLCRSAGLYCDRVGTLTQALLAGYGGDLSHAPQYDAMYVRFLLDAYGVTDDPRLYQVAFRNALRAEASAAAGDGLFTRGWDGGSGEGGSALQAHAATLEALAWAAAATPP